MLLARMGSAAQIDNSVGLRQQPQAALAPHSDVVAAHDITTADVEERPTIAKPEAVHHLP